MKLFLVLVMLGTLAMFHCEAEGTNGFLVFTVERYAYQESGTNADLKQAFKVPLTSEFLANFKHSPSTNRAGTGFYCAGGNFLNASQGGTAFIWWLSRTKDRRWNVHMWGEGNEEINGTQFQSRNPAVSQDTIVRQLEDLYLSYQVSYVNHYDGLNVQFTAQYMSAQELQALGSVPTAPVQKAGRGMLFPGDIPTNCPLRFTCSFQEN